MQLDHFARRPGIADPTVMEWAVTAQDNHVSLEFSHVAHSYADVAALRDVSFTAHTAEITCLLGSSGCGKSTLLNLAAGLLPMQQGTISVDGTQLAGPGVNPPPEARPVGLVFQDGALFPHLNIARNIGFGLEDFGRSRDGRAEAATMVDEWLERIGLSGLGERYPHELSGGQQQRAALARAMAPDPQVLLMDEPFASVDIVLRRRLRRDCRLLLRESRTTTVLVTHDPEEALDIADRIAVMEHGRIVQFGTPQELHDTPQAASVGAIFGGAQIVPAQREGGTLRTPFGNWPMTCIHGDAPDCAQLDLLIYAERLDCLADPDGLNVRDVHPIGAANRVLMATANGEEITAVTHAALDATSPIRPVPQKESVLAFARD
ncbi:MAG: ABC transporter ATP-binding protein [Erythrobacter sp.]